MIFNKEQNFTQYTNDSTFILNGINKSLNWTLNELLKFSQFSGFKVDFHLQAIWIRLGIFGSSTIKTRWI